MPRLRPQAVGEELLRVLLLLFALNPGVFLAVGDDFEGEAEEEEGEAENVGEVGAGGESGSEDRGGEGRARDGIYQDNGESAERDPGGLGEEGAIEFCGRAANRVEA